MSLSVPVLRDSSGGAATRIEGEKNLKELSHLTSTKQIQNNPHKKKWPFSSTTGKEK